MFKKRKLVLIGIGIAILLFSSGTYYIFLNNKGKDINHGNNNISAPVFQEKPLLGITGPDGKQYVKENKYYIIYLDNGNRSSSFIPAKLNPGYEYADDVGVSISIDDAGNIINDGKIIVVYNNTLSKSNKERIKKIAGEEYDEALKEIQEGINEVKNNKGL